MSLHRIRLAVFGLLLWAGGDALPAHTRSDPSAPSPSVLRSEFIFETAPFASAHASTIVETKQGLVAAWFGGTRERAADVGIWLSRQVDGTWTAPIEVATGIQPDARGTRVGTRFCSSCPTRHCCSFYKVGPTPQSWWGMVRRSRDEGRTWSDARRLPDGILGPIKNKPVRLADGTLLSPSSTESPENGGTWRVHFERSADAGLTWTAVSPPVSAGGRQIHAIQPSILTHPGGRLQAVGRTQSGRVSSRPGPRTAEERGPWKRQRIKHVVIDPEKLEPIPMPDGKWPSEPAPQSASGTDYAVLFTSVDNGKQGKCVTAECRLQWSWMGRENR